jgi:hypothetical protein
MIAVRCSWSSLAPAFRDMLQRQDIEKTRETLNSLNASTKIFTLGLGPASYLFQRQLWRFQDLSDGGGLSSSVELLLLALKQLLYTSLSQEFQSALYVRIFRAITSDWSAYKHCWDTENPSRCSCVKLWHRLQLLSEISSRCF